MKIVDKTLNNDKKFKDLKIGDAFKHHECLHIKNSKTTAYIPCSTMTTGINENSTVTQVYLEVIIHQNPVE